VERKPIKLIRKKVVEDEFGDGLEEEIIDELQESELEDDLDEELLEEEGNSEELPQKQTTPAATSYYNVIMDGLQRSSSISRSKALLEMSRLGQRASREYLTTFVEQHKLSSDWKTLLYKLVPKFSELSTENVANKEWSNIAKVVDIISTQGVSDELYNRLYIHAFPPEKEGDSGEEIKKPSYFSQAYACRGLDVGTVNIVGSYALKESGEPRFNRLRNAFLDMRSDEFTRDMLKKLKMPVVALGEKQCVVGDAAFKLANIFGSATRRPMSGGLISTDEDDALVIIEKIILDAIGMGSGDDPCVFTVPANPVDDERNNVYHTGVIEMILKRLGYSPQKIEEGHSVIFSECADSAYTGIGVSCGGGMSNICVSYRSVPALSFAISRGGDWIDKHVSESLDMPMSHVSAVKEAGMHLEDPQGRVQQALRIYYLDLIKYTLEHISQQIVNKNNMPVFNEPIDVVLCGGTSMVGGFVEVFEEEMRSLSWPLDIAKVRMANDPLKTVAHGCLNASLEYLASLG